MIGTRFFDSNLYRVARKPYSDKLIGIINDLFSNKKSVNLAEIGAGDGRFTDILIRTNINIKTLYIIEPDPIANTKHRKNFSGLQYPVVYKETPSHQTLLDDHSIDLIFTAQSFHWFNIDRTRPEFMRILKPHGRVFIFGRFLDESDPTTAQYVRLTRFGKRQNNVRANIELYSDNVINSFYGHSVKRHVVCTENFQYTLQNILNEVKIRIDSSADDDLKNDPKKQNAIFDSMESFFFRHKHSELVTLQHFSFYYFDEIH